MTCVDCLDHHLVQEYLDVRILFARKTFLILLSIIFCSCSLRVPEQQVTQHSGIRMLRIACSEHQGRKLENATLNDLGRARTVTATKDFTTIVEGAGSP